MDPAQLLGRCPDNLVLVVGPRRLEDLAAGAIADALVEQHQAESTALAVVSRTWSISSRQTEV